MCPKNRAENAKLFFVEYLHARWKIAKSCAEANAAHNKDGTNLLSTCLYEFYSGRYHLKFSAPSVKVSCTHRATLELTFTDTSKRYVIKYTWLNALMIDSY